MLHKGDDEAILVNSLSFQFLLGCYEILLEQEYYRRLLELSIPFRMLQSVYTIPYQTPNHTFNSF